MTTHNLFTTSDAAVIAEIQAKIETYGPVVVLDADTDPGNVGTIIRTAHAAGAAAVHIEDQVSAKLCGHLPGKHLVPTADMVARVRAAVAGKPHGKPKAPGKGKRKR